MTSPDPLEPKCSQCSKEELVLVNALCWRCWTRGQGFQCAVCGSPWVYLLAWGGCEEHDSRCACPKEMPSIPYCKPCSYSYAQREGYFDGFEEWMERAKARERERIAKIEEKMKKNPILPPEKRKYKKKGEDDGDNLFSLDKPTD